MRITFIGAVLAYGVALSGCGTHSTTAPEAGVAFTAVSRNVFIVGDSLTLAGDADSVLTFDVSRGVPRIAPNSIIVGTDNGGYIRRVHSTRVEGKRLFVNASPAYLTDAVISGRIDTTLALGFDSSPEDGVSLAGMTLYSAEDSSGARVTVTITNGRLQFNPEIDLFAEFGLHDVSGFRAAVTGDLSLTCDATVEASGPLHDELSFETPVATVRRTVFQHIGRVPVVEVVTMSYIAGFTVNAGYSGTSAIGIQAAEHVQCSVKYNHRAWSSANDGSPQFTAHPYSYESTGQASIELHVVPRVRVDFYNLPCVRLELGPSFGLSELDAGFPVLEWDLWADMLGRSSFERGGLDRGVRTYDSSQPCCRVTLDSGPFRTDQYIFIKQWGNETIPWDGSLYYPKGIAVDRAGDVYVSDNWGNFVKKFAADGAFLGGWGAAGSGDGQFDSPEKIAVDEDGYVYVVDSGNNRIQKFTADGAFVAKWGVEGTGDGEFMSPVGVAASGGVVYVTDSGNQRVEEFSTSGAFIGAWGSFGSAPGQFDGPAGVAIVPGEGAVLVADCHNNRIQRFSPGGVPLSFGTVGDLFDCAVDVTTTAGGEIFAADLGNDRFLRLAFGGSFETQLGTKGTGPGQFDHPEAVAVDSRGYVYVVDSRNRRIQEFAPRTQ
ncbi:MAG: hypothetical protein ABR899_04105 [Candidatus Krumholzibacteriaceae bacterium]